jgi:hypothetical protein
VGKAERRKGHDWERDVARELSIAGIPHKRVLSESRDGNSGDVTPTKQKPSMPIAVIKQDRQEAVVVISFHDFLDLYYWCEGLEVGKVGFLVQCKVGKQPPVMPAYREAVEAFDALSD